MRKFFLMMVLTVGIFWSMASAQTTLYLRNISSSNNNECQDVCLITSHTFDSTTAWSIAAFGDVYRGWGEAYLGPRYSLTPWLFISLYAGMETLGWRAAADINLSYQNSNLYTVYEYGESGTNNDYLFCDLTQKFSSIFKGEVKIKKIGSNWWVGPGAIANLSATSSFSFSALPYYNCSTKKIELELMAYVNY